MFNAQCVSSQKAERRLCRRRMKLDLAICSLNLISDFTNPDKDLIEDNFLNKFKIPEPNVQCTVRQFTKGREE